MKDMFCFVDGPFQQAQQLEFLPEVFGGLETGVSPSNRTGTPASRMGLRRRRRACSPERAAWWFDRMRRVVDAQPDGPRTR